MSSSYHYSSLPDKARHIRVFDLEAPATDVVDYQNDRIQGTLRCVSLNDKPEFTALSYVWGNSIASSVYVLCNGCRLAVTRNCYSALLHLRKEFGALTIWIDSICINQSDESEKGHQIFLMGDIYTRAHSTFIWLGEGTAQTDRAMAYMGGTQIQQYYEINPEGQDVSHIRAASWYIAFAEWSFLMQAVPSVGM